eukprot:4908810-Amphidinium_carterae.1
MGLYLNCTILKATSQWLVLCMYARYGCWLCSLHTHTHTHTARRSCKRHEYINVNLTSARASSVKSGNPSIRLQPNVSLDRVQALVTFQESTWKSKKTKRRASLKMPHPSPFPLHPRMKGLTTTVSQVESFGTWNVAFAVLCWGTYIQHQGRRR